MKTQKTIFLCLSLLVITSHCYASGLKFPSGTVKTTSKISPDTVVTNLLSADVITTNNITADTAVINTVSAGTATIDGNTTLVGTRGVGEILTLEIDANGQAFMDIDRGGDTFSRTALLQFSTANVGQFTLGLRDAEDILYTTDESGNVQMYVQDRGGSGDLVVTGSITSDTAIVGNLIPGDQGTFAGAVTMASTLDVTGDTRAKILTADTSVVSNYISADNIDVATDIEAGDDVSVGDEVKDNVDGNTKVDFGVNDNLKLSAGNVDFYLIQEGGSDVHTLNPDFEDINTVINTDNATAVHVDGGSDVLYISVDSVVNDISVDAISVTNLVTGTNAGSDVCIDANGTLCICTTCA